MLSSENNEIQLSKVLNFSQINNNTDEEMLVDLNTFETSNMIRLRPSF